MSDNELSPDRLLVVLDELVAARGRPILVPDIGRQVEALEARGLLRAHDDSEELARLLAQVRTLVAHGLVDRTDQGYELTDTGRKRAAEESQEMDSTLKEAIQRAAGALAHES